MEALVNRISSVKQTAATSPNELEYSLKELKDHTSYLKKELDLLDYLFGDQVKEDWRAYRSKMLLKSQEILAEAKSDKWKPILGSQPMQIVHLLDITYLRLKDSKEEWVPGDMNLTFGLLRSMDSMLSFFPFPKKVCLINCSFFSAILSLFQSLRLTQNSIFLC